MLRQIAVAVACAAWLAPGGSSAATIGHPIQRQNLVDNPGFEILDAQTGLPAGWRRDSPRDEIAPRFEADASTVHSGKYAAKITAKGSPGTFGFWTTSVKGIQGSDSPADESPPEALAVNGTDFLGKRSYRVRCFFKAKDIESVERNIWIRIRWNTEKGKEVLAQYLPRYQQESGWYKVEEVLVAPLVARSLTLELVLQWTASGTVWWDDISVEEAESPGPRRLKVATVSYAPPPHSTPEQNRRFFAEKVEAAGKLGVDLVCLGEGITVVSTGKKFQEVAESVPGPTSHLLGDVARRYHTYVVAGIYERDGSLIYNTALLIDRQGNVGGKYRKTHLPETEISGGLTPGDSYPVFHTDFGTIGIEICYDNFFPEVARSLAVQGAELILLPIWGDMRGQGYEWDVVARARAIDNAVFLIASIYSNKRSLIISPDGHILADTGGESGLVMTEIDLGTRTFDRGLSVPGYGEWKSLYPKERRTETYRMLATKPME